MAIESLFTKLLTFCLVRFPYSVAMIGQPVMKNNGRCNAESKYNHHKGSYKLLYDDWFKQDSLFATMLQIYAFFKKFTYKSVGETDKKNIGN